jgi:hypothetical protein
MTDQNRPEIRNGILLGLFLVIIYSPLALVYSNKDAEVSEVEKRTLAVLPEAPLSVVDIQSFPSKFEAFYADHFGLRERFIYGYNVVKFIIGDSSSDDVMRGKNGWFFLGSPKHNTRFTNSIDSALNRTTYSDERLKQIANYFEAKKRWLEERGIKYIFMVVPDKHTIYPEKLPNYARRPPGPIAADQLTDYLKAHTSVKVVDIKNSLMRGKKDAILYYQTDSHWNFNGANIAQFEIMKAINDFFSDTPPATRFKVELSAPLRGDLSKFLGIDAYDDYNPKPVFKDTCKPKLLDVPKTLIKRNVYRCNTATKSLLVFRDSFFEALIPFLSRNFEKSTFLGSKGTYEILETYVESESPDLVIEEWVESRAISVNIDSRFLPALFKKQFHDSLLTTFVLEPDTFRLNNSIVQIAKTRNSFTFEVTTNTPYLEISDIQFEPNKSYVLHLVIDSSINSTTRIFYTDADQKTGYPYSSDREERAKILKGENDIYVPLSFYNLGSRLRLDPTLAPGIITIKTLEIREIAKQ